MHDKNRLGSFGNRLCGIRTGVVELQTHCATYEQSVQGTDDPRRIRAAGGVTSYYFSVKLFPTPEGTLHCIG